MPSTEGLMQIKIHDRWPPQTAMRIATFAHGLNVSDASKHVMGMPTCQLHFKCLCLHYIYMIVLIILNII